MALTNIQYSPGRILTIDQCDSKGRENQSVVADMDGTLLVGRSSFPYFALIAFDVGGILRLVFLLLVAPIAGMLYHFLSESAGIRVLIFATFCGVKIEDVESAARAVLPKHYSEDMHPETWRVFSSFGRKCVLTANPRVMVEPYLKNYLGVDVVLGTEILSYKGIATGLVTSSGVLVGTNKAVALGRTFGAESVPNIGIGDRDTDFPFMALCKERYIVPSSAGVRPMKPETLPKPVIFHDGRLVQKPTPLLALLIVMWFPIGMFLSVIRTIVGSLLPIASSSKFMSLLGCPIATKGTLPIDPKQNPSVKKGVVVVCSHRTVIDAVYTSAAMGRMTTTISYSVPRLTEFLSPVKTARLTRDRAKDAKLIEKILNEGRYLVMCPEGTTCREPYLLRFSSLFAELTDDIVPVALAVKESMFYGTTARGYKWLDPLFFYMNPFPAYEVTFLNKLSPDQTCGGAGKSSYEVANSVQEMIGKTLGYKCTNLTRKDKYRELVGTDGLVGQKPTKYISYNRVGFE